MKKPLAQNERFMNVAAPLALALLALAAWQILVMASGVPKYILPTPLEIGAALIHGWPSLFHAFLITLKITFLSFLASVVIGVALSLLMIQSRWIEISLFPYAVILQVTPIVAIAPLIIIWVKTTELALIICATIISIFPIIANTILGLRSVNPNLSNLFALYGASRLQILARLRIPSALPYFFAGLRISSGLALIGAVVAEFVAGTGGSRAGLAYEILQAGYNLNIPRMFAALVLITGAGIVLFLLMGLLSRLALRRWHESELKVEQ